MMHILSNLQFCFVDLFAIIVYICSIVFYRCFLSLMLNKSPDRLFLGKLQEYRIAWISEFMGANDCIIVVQTLRNTIMSASFLASTAVVLIMGSLNLLPHIRSLDKLIKLIGMFGSPNPDLEMIKILLAIITLSYSFFHFTCYIREANYLSFMLNVPKNQLDKIEGCDSKDLLAKIFLHAGIHFSLGMRGYYFLFPLFMWLFSPILMILSILLILWFLLKRDLDRSSKDVRNDFHDKKHIIRNDLKSSMKI